MKVTTTLKVDEKRLLAYAVAAGAVLAAAGPADASVIGGTVNQLVKVTYISPTNPTPQFVQVDIGNTGAVFLFFNTQHLFTNQLRTPNPGIWSYRNGYVIAGNAVVNAYTPPPANSTHIALNIPKNDPVRSTGATMPWMFDLEKNKQGGSGAKTIGYFLTPAGGYLGFKITADGAAKGYTGWIHIDSIDPNFSSYTIVDWAYTTDVSTPILAGEGPTAVPEPTSSALALIAMGAAGLAIYRKRKQDAQA